MDIKKLPIATAMVLGALLVGSSARADLIILGSIDQGAPTPLADDPNGLAVNVPLASLGLLTLTQLAAMSDTPGTPVLSQLTSSSSAPAAGTITNNSVGTAFTLTLLVSATNFIAPTAPPAVELISQISTTTTTGGTGNTLSYISCVAANNSHTCPATDNTAPVHPNITAVGSSSAVDTLLIASLAPLFSLNELVTITLAPGAAVDFSASTRLVPAPTPLPAALPLFATGLGALGLLGWRRKRKAHAVA